MPSDRSLGSVKTVKSRDGNEGEHDATPEYVPLRRATTTGPMIRTAGDRLDKRRKKSAPLSLFRSQYDNDIVENKSTDSLPSKLDSPATRHKATRYNG